MRAAGLVVFDPSLRLVVLADTPHPAMPCKGVSLGPAGRCTPKGVVASSTYRGGARRKSLLRADDASVARDEHQPCRLGVPDDQSETIRKEDDRDSTDHLGAWT